MEHISLLSELSRMVARDQTDTCLERGLLSVLHNRV